MVKTQTYQVSFDFPVKVSCFIPGLGFLPFQNSNAAVDPGNADLFQNLRLILQPITICFIQSSSLLS